MSYHPVPVSSIILRGGSLYSVTPHMRVTVRYSSTLQYQDEILGVRLIRRAL